MTSACRADPEQGAWDRASPDRVTPERTTTDQATRVELPELGVSLEAPGSWSGLDHGRAARRLGSCVGAAGKLGRYEVYTPTCSMPAQTSVNADSQYFTAPPATPSPEQQLERVRYPGGTIVLVSIERQEYTNWANIARSELAFVTPDHGHPFVLASLAWPAYRVRADPDFRRRVRILRPLEQGRPTAPPGQGRSTTSAGTPYVS